MEKYVVIFRNVFTIVWARDEEDAKRLSLSDFSDYGATTGNYDEMEVERVALANSKKG